MSSQGDGVYYKENRAARRNRRFGQIDNMKERELGDGVRYGPDNAKITYSRKLNYEPGYYDLTRIVAGLGKGVKQYRNLSTLEEAQAYVTAKDRKGNLIRPNWEAIETDITGPNGTPDGVPEVLITDSKGSVKMVNGYGLKESDYPWRRAYKITAPDDMKLKEWRYHAYDMDVDKDGNAYYVNDLNDYSHDVDENGVAYLNDVRRSKINPKQLFIRLIIKEIWDGFKESIAEWRIQNDFTGLVCAQMCSNITNLLFDGYIKNPIICEEFNSEFLDPIEVMSRDERKSLNKFKNSDKYKTLLMKRATDFINYYRADTNGIQSILAQQFGSLLEQICAILIDQEANGRVPCAYVLKYNGTFDWENGEGNVDFYREDSDEHIENLKAVSRNSQFRRTLNLPPINKSLLTQSLLTATEAPQPAPQPAPQAAPPPKRSSGLKFGGKTLTQRAVQALNAPTVVIRKGPSLDAESNLPKSRQFSGAPSGRSSFTKK